MLPGDGNGLKLLHTTYTKESKTSSHSTSFLNMNVFLTSRGHTHKRIITMHECFCETQISEKHNPCSKRRPSHPEFNFELRRTLASSEGEHFGWGYDTDRDAEVRFGPVL